jgi:hypothetical protein
MSQPDGVMAGLGFLGHGLHHRRLREMLRADAGKPTGLRLWAYAAGEVWPWARCPLAGGLLTLCLSETTSEA